MQPKISSSYISSFAYKQIFKTLSFRSGQQKSINSYQKLYQNISILIK